MIFRFRHFFQDFEPAATVENLGVAPVPAPPVDLAEFAHDLEGIFEAGRQHIASTQHSSPA